MISLQEERPGGVQGKSCYCAVCIFWMEMISLLVKPAQHLPNILKCQGDILVRPRRSKKMVNFLLSFRVVMLMLTIMIKVFFFQIMPCLP